MTLRIAAVADSQVDEHSRLEEHDRVMRVVVEEAAERGCDVLLHAGDVYERRSTAREREAVAGWIIEATAQYGLAVGVVGGNHEAAGEVDELAHLGIDATERPEMWTHMEGLAVACLPWPRRSSLLAWLTAQGLGVTREDVNQRGAELLRDVLRGFASQWPADVPRVLLAHAMVRGSRHGPDQPPLLGCDFELGLEDLALADADVVILGHIHCPQEWSYTAADGREVPVIYCGSPRRTAYAKGELEPKGFVVVEFDGRRLVSWERVATPATPMVLVETVYEREDDEEAFATSDGSVWPGSLPDWPPPGAEIRLRYAVDADQRDAARRRAEEIRDEWIAAGAAEVRIEEQVRPTVRARAPEVASAVGTPDKLRAYWSATDAGLDEERMERLLGRLREVGEVRS